MKEKEIKINPIGYVRVVEKNPNEFDYFLEIKKHYRSALTGIFATRAEYRPNPIALTTCAIQDVDEENGIVKLNGIDAFSGTPIVDIKAYFPICDRVRDCYIAPWLKDWPEWMEDGAAWWEEQGFFEENG